MNIEHNIWMRKDWWDPEPDRFSVQVRNSSGSTERFLVVSGNATWLNIQQAKEVRDYLDRCILNMETMGDAEPTAQEDPTPRTLPRRKHKDTEMAEMDAVVRKVASFLDSNYPCKCGDDEGCSGNMAEADEIVRLVRWEVGGVFLASAWDEGHESGFWNGRESAGSGEMGLCGVEHAKANNPYRVT